MRLVAEEPAAEHHVRPAFDDRLQQSRDLGRVVFEIGVLNDDGVARRLEEAGADGRSLSLVHVVKVDRQAVAADRHSAGSRTP